MATIAENLQTIQNIKQNIKTAIENKGVDMTNTPFSEYSTKIDEISAGGGTSTVYVPDGMIFRNSTITSFPDWNCSNITNAREMFTFCTNLESIDIDLSNTTTGWQTFAYCSKLSTVKLQLKNICDMSAMFGACSNLTKVDGSWDCSNVTTVTSLFYGCTSLRGVLPLSNMGAGYVGDSDIILDLSSSSNFTRNEVISTIGTLSNVKNNSNFTGNAIIKLSQNVLADFNNAEIIAATTKGWTLTA